MLFQTLDDKTECVAVYKDGSLHQGRLPENLTHTWSASGYLSGLPIQYAYLYCQTSLAKACPDHMRGEFDEVMSLMRAFVVSLSEAKIDLNTNCFYDLVPQAFLVRFCAVKDKICQHIFNTFEAPSDYLFLKELHELTNEISYRELNLNFNSQGLDYSSFKNRNKLKTIRSIPPYVKYNIFGSKTGRLTTRPNTFPILNINKDLRALIRPNNFRFVELDFNAFEIRTLLYLLGKEQPNIDIHQWNSDNTYRGTVTRDQAKTRIFAWLYNLDSKDSLSEGVYNRTDILNKYWDGERVVNPFGRAIESDKFHAVSYLVQSTAADIVLRQMLKLNKLLKNKKSYIAFTVHDSVVIDMAEEDMGLLPEIKKEFSTFGDAQFLANVSIGSDFGNMESEE